MNSESTNPNENQDSIQEQLVAYLDGELDPDTSRDFERRLSEDIELRRLVQQHQRTWDLLDDIPRAEAGETFSRTTVEMVALSAENDVSNMKRKTARRRGLAWASAAGGMILAAAAGYVIMWSMLSAPNHRLAEDLPVVENLDAYRHAESIEFLRAMEREGLFTAEVDDAP